MKIISTKEYNKLKKTQSAYLDLLVKPLQGVFEKITDDDLLRENGLLNAENERLNNILNELEEYLQNQKDEHSGSWHYREWIRQVLKKLQELKGENKKWK